MFLALAIDVALNAATATKVIAIAAVIYPVLELVKKLIPQVSGWYSVGLNVFLSTVGIIMAVPADQLFTLNTLIMLVTASTAAAGIHGTVQNMRTAPIEPLAPIEPVAPITPKP